MGISMLALAHKYAYTLSSFIGFYGLLVMYFGLLILASWGIDVYFHIFIKYKANRMLVSNIFLNVS